MEALWSTVAIPPRKRLSKKHVFAQIVLKSHCGPIHSDRGFARRGQEYSGRGDVCKDMTTTERNQREFHGT